MNRLLLSLLIVSIMGCVSAPAVRPIPALVAAANYSEGSLKRDESAAWWHALQDETLNALIAQGLNGSPSARIAMSRLAQAESGLKIATAARWPALSGSASRAVRDVSGSGADTRSDAGALNLSWDVGLWGKRRLEIEDALQFKNQRWFENQSVQLALSTSIAEVYFQIVEQRMQSSLLAGQLDVSADLERLIEARFRRGQARVSELYQQRESTQTLAQLKIIVDTDLEAYERSLDVLLGEVPDSLARVSADSVPTDLAGVYGGAAEDLITNRADLRAGYARLQQAAALAGIRFAERLPSLTVTANLTSLAQKSMSMEWVGHGLDLAIPIFSGGRLRGLEEQALHALEEERQRYLELWLTALEEISTLRLQYQQQKRVIATLEQRRSYADKALQAARNRYVLGDQNYLDVLTALRGLQDADRFLISERRLLISLWVQTTAASGQPMCQLEEACTQNWEI